MVAVSNNKGITGSLDYNGNLQSRIMFQKLSSGWGNRAQVKKKECNYKDTFNLDLSDFTEELIPFHDHPVYQKLDLLTKQKILSCAWIVYNQKTISLETEIVNPLCVDIISAKLPGLTDPEFKLAASQIMVDESYHVLMVVSSNSVTIEKRGLDFQLNKLNFVKLMQEEQAMYSDYLSKVIIQMTTALVAEIFTSHSMETLSKDETIQPLHHDTVVAHLMDELVHGRLFTYMAQQFYKNLPRDKQEFFVSTFYKPMLWLSDVEAGNWRIMLESININGAESDAILSCLAEINIMRKKHMDYSNLILLANKIGINKGELLAAIDNKL